MPCLGGRFNLYRRIRKIAENNLISSCLSVRMQQRGSSWREFHEEFFENPLRKYEFG